MLSAFCNKDTTLLTFDATAKEIADRWASKLNGRWGDLTGRADRMITAADQLITNKSKMAPNLKRNVVATLASIQAIKEGELQGSNNPKIRVWMEYGKDQHESRQRSCSVNELTISSSYCENPIRDGSDCRLDCLEISGNDCRVIEIKPDNPEAVDDGRKQASAYRKGLMAMYLDKKDDMFQGDFEKLKVCKDSEGRFALADANVETYARCLGDKSSLGDGVSTPPLDPIPDDDEP